MTLLCLFVFSLVSRLPEFLSMVLPVNLRLALVLTGLSFLAILGNRGYTRIFPAPIAVLFTLMAGWIILSTPFSIWRRGSLSVLVSFWFLSMASYYFVSGAPITLEDLRRVMAWIGAAVVVLLVVSRWFVISTEGRLALLLPSLANPNLFAMQLLYGLPFVPLLFFKRHKLLRGVLTAGVIGISLLLLARTGSRAALIAALVMFVLMIFFVKGFRKVPYMVIGAVLVLSAFVFSGSVALDRYLTLLSDDANSVQSVSARESGFVRWKLLVQSLQITAENPLFGVGPGNFSVATADMKEEDETAIAWLGSHNTPTQISSEAGIVPGVCFLALTLLSLSESYRLYRQSMKVGHKLAVTISFALFLSIIGMFVVSLFASIAYQFYFPLLFGLITAAVRIIPLELAASAPAASNVVTLPTPLPALSLPGLGSRPAPAAYGIPAGAISRVPAAATTSTAGASPERLRRPPRQWGRPLSEPVAGFLNKK